MQYINLNNVQRVIVNQPKGEETFHLWIEWTGPEGDEYDILWQFWKKETAEGIAKDMAEAANKGVKFYLFPEEQYIQDHEIHYQEYLKSQNAE